MVAGSLFTMVAGSLCARRLMACGGGEGAGGLPVRGGDGGGNGGGGGGGV